MSGLLEPVITAEELARRTAQLGAEISERYRGQDLLVVGVLKGAFMFLADLVRHISIPAHVDFVRVSSYGADVKPGELKFVQDLDSPCKGRHVLVVEDIVDTGNSMSMLLAELSQRGAASVRLCALIDKVERRKTQVTVDFPGFRLAKGFLVGYGLDFAEDYRCLPGVYELIQQEGP
ncbi:Hypoxanthine phosphoribosyltransferase [Fundidesulfovibrio magnetotacticus]|uniref:Hypoxanthine phosphoribosyltransferase n=1 Tax=Fundidesulfovibrio magnetotacticus TaxID=2730080 RepID=A0A6V8M0E9_9BACT|nr:hypoxanthine phosphoribosyltransferase [Fundidesulfovibrio magnetotacticus]GFK95506.1 Hypoxanthine phosphoribosyltransferase [Fundidesulfovibrio magnetotacticus]